MKSFIFIANIKIDARDSKEALLIAKKHINKIMTKHPNRVIKGLIKSQIEIKQG
jgi:hypothetical protein